ncbi:MAG: DUF3572 family protein [Alphaproteobacteria bacterium]|jgi:hypothetical protein|nr:DUF3572 family protein [Alphaproteobacteria bacterium]MDP6813604.1 DUF3572 family protein [Alphaproteobacteria bacterium]
MTRDEAVIVGLRALSYLAGDEAALQRFIALTGIDGGSLGRGAEDPAVLAGVLDFFLGNEKQLLEMCAAAELAADLPAKARRQLPGATYQE